MKAFQSNEDYFKTIEARDKAVQLLQKVKRS